MLERFGRSNPFASTQPFRDEFDEHQQESANRQVPSVPVSSSAWGPAGNGVGNTRGSGGNSWLGSGRVAPIHAVDGDISAREEALRKREAELLKREERVAAAEATLGWFLSLFMVRFHRVHGNRKNWPKFKPFLRHSISEDVPAERRGLVWRNYWAWVLGAFGFGWNWLIVTIMFIASRKSLPNWLFASLISGFGLPGSFMFWHRNLYKAAMSDGTLRWMLFICFSFAQLITAGWTFVAPPIVGGWAVGLLTMIDQFKDGGGAGIFFGICAIINVVAWGLCGLLTFITLVVISISTSEIQKLLKCKDGRLPLQAQTANGEGSATFRGRPKTQPRPSSAQLRVLSQMADARV